MEQTDAYIFQVYKKVCDAYANEPDENGDSFIARLQKERSEIGNKAPHRKPISNAESQFLKYDCVFISAERSPENGGTEESNDANTKKLQKELQRLKEQGLLLFYDSEGEYQEINSNEIQKERGFFCTDIGPQVAYKFFKKLFKLSESYNQDAFLFKSAGGRMSRTGFFIATNEAAIKKYDKGYWKAGELYINLPPEGFRSKYKDIFGKDIRIYFRCEKPTLDQLEYSRHQL